MLSAAGPKEQSRFAEGIATLPQAWRTRRPNQPEAGIIENTGLTLN